MNSWCAGTSQRWNRGTRSSASRNGGRKRGVHHAALMGVAPNASNASIAPFVDQSDRHKTVRETMKLFGFIAALSAITVMEPAQVAAADLCDYAELPTQLGDLVEPAFKCQTASGYSFVTPSTLPTDAEVAKICAQCADFITAALAPTTKLPACQLVLDSGSAVTVSNFFQGIASKCASNATAPSPAASGSSSASTTTAPAPVIAAIPIVTTPPSSDPPATSKPPTTVSPPKSQSTSAPSKSPSKSVSGDKDESDDSDDTVSDHSEAREDIHDSTSGDDDSSPDSADNTPTSEPDSQEDLPSGGSPSKSKTTSTTTVATKTSHASGVAHASLASVATALMAASLVTLRA